MPKQSREGLGGFVWRATGIEGTAALMDGVIVLLFVPLLVGDVGQSRSRTSGDTSGDAHVSLAQCGLDALLLASAVGAAVCLLCGCGPGVRLQRAVFWALLLRGSVLLFLPGGGVGGFLMLVEAVLLLALAAVGLCVAILLHRAGQRAV